MTTKTPFMEKYGYTETDMQTMYGDSWACFNGVLTCPHCGSDLRDIVLGTPFKREIYVVDQESDRVAYVKCPDCDDVIRKMHRWVR